MAPEASARALFLVARDGYARLTGSTANIREQSEIWIKTKSAILQKKIAAERMIQEKKSAALRARAARVIPGAVNSPVRAWKSVGGATRFIARGESAAVIDAANSAGCFSCSYTHNTQQPPVASPERQLDEYNR